MVTLDGRSGQQDFQPPRPLILPKMGGGVWDGLHRLWVLISRTAAVRRVPHPSRVFFCEKGGSKVRTTEQTMSDSVHSREAAKECSPQRKLWDSGQRRAQPRRGERRDRCFHKVGAGSLGFALGLAGTAKYRGAPSFSRFLREGRQNGRPRERTSCVSSRASQSSAEQFSARGAEYAEKSGAEHEKCARFGHCPEEGGVQKIITSTRIGLEQRVNIPTERAFPLENLASKPFTKWISADAKLNEGNRLVVDY
jgi:hypothetical protein